MLFPKLKAGKEKEYRVDKTGSLVFGENVPDGCFSDCLNLTGDKFPLMSARARRAYYESSAGFDTGGEEITAVTDTPAGLLVCTETAVYLDGTALEGATLSADVKSRQAILTGRNVFIAPDGVFIKCTDAGAEVCLCSLEAFFSSAVLTYCTEDGTDIFPDYQGDIPASAETGESLITAADGKMVYMTYTGEKWLSRFDIFIRINFMTELTGFTAEDAVQIECTGDCLTDGCYTVKTVLPESLVLTGILTAEGDVTRVTLKKSMPKIDFACEHNNRIWACRYGRNNDGEFVNEIYASRLGDPTVWQSFQGISTDSYAVSLGCPGEFTGVGKVGSEVIFFKENYLIRVMGSEPSEFTVSTVPARGIEHGQEKSLVNLGERLFYKSTDGITVYDGSLPFVISEKNAFSGFSEAVAGAEGGKYIIALTSPSGERFIFVYDTENGLWHKEEDSLHTLCMFRKDGNLFHVCRQENRVFVRDFPRLSEGNAFLPLFGEVGFLPEAEASVGWYGETGKICRNITSRNKKVRAVRFSLTLPEDSVFRVLIKPDSAELFRELFFLDRKTDGIFSCTVPVPQCKFFTLRFEGTGDFTLHGYSAIISYTGEVNDIE